MIVESSKNQYPTSFKVSPDIQHLKSTTWTDSLKQFNKGLLTTSHMTGDAPFPLPWPLVSEGGG